MSIDPKEGGGAVERICNLSKYLSLNGHQCTLLTTSKNFSYSRKRSLGKVNVVKLPYFSERFLIPFGLFKWLKKNIKNYDTIHLSLNWSVITAFAFIFLYFNKVDYYFSAMGWLKISGRSKFFKFVYKHFITIPMVKNSKKCIAITDREVQDFVIYGAKKKNIVRIPNGIDVNYYLKYHSDNIFKKKNNLKKKKIILYIGRIDKIKGVDLLVNAFINIHKQFQNHQLVICGFDGGILDNLKQLVKKNKIENKVSFFDPIWGNDKISAYRSADVVVIPSRYDTMTIVALEAGVLKTPIIISKQSNFNEVKKSKGAIIVNSNSQMISIALRDLLKNRKKLKSMGKNIQNFIIKNYDWNLICKKFLTAFEGKKKF